MDKNYKNETKKKQISKQIQDLNGSLVPLRLHKFQTRF